MTSQRRVALVTSINAAALERMREYVRDGWNLALYNTSNSILQLRDEITRAYPGIRVSVHSGDLATAPAVDRLLAGVLTEHRRIDAVVNSSGTAMQKPNPEMSEADFYRLLAYGIFVDEQRRRSVEQLGAATSRTTGRGVGAA